MQSCKRIVSCRAARYKTIIPKIDIFNILVYKVYKIKK